MTPTPQPITDTLAALEAFAQVCQLHKIAATVDTIDGARIGQAYEAAASTNPHRLASHIRRLKKNPFASQLRAQAEAAAAMSAMRQAYPSHPPQKPA